MDTHYWMTPDELLEYDDFLHNIARRLVFDEQSSDDITQQAWLAVLQKPPSSQRVMRSWFWKVIRNISVKFRRSEIRRRSRERAAAVSESVPSAEEIASKEELRRKVADAVLRLDEPYRSAVLLTYYHGLSSKKMAAQLDVPVETARSRLKRGVAKLRCDLDKSYNGNRNEWRFALAPMVGLEVVESSGAVALTNATAGKRAWIFDGLSTTAKVKASVAAVVLIGAAIVFWQNLITPDGLINKNLPEDAVKVAGVSLEQITNQEKTEAFKADDDPKKERELIKPGGKPAAPQAIGSSASRKLSWPTGKPGWMVKGRIITDSQSKGIADLPLMGARVVFQFGRYSNTMGMYYTDMTAPILSDKDGCFSLFLPVPDWLIEDKNALEEGVELVGVARLKGYDLGAESKALYKAPAPDDQPLHFDFQLNKGDKGDLCGCVVFKDGRPTSEAIIYTLTPEKKWKKSCLTKPDGSFIVKTDQEGVVNVVAFKYYVGVSSIVGLEANHGDLKSPWPSIVLDSLETISGVLVDPEDNPLPEMTVVALPAEEKDLTLKELRVRYKEMDNLYLSQMLPDPMGLSKPGSRFAVCTTEMDGSFNLQGLRSGEYAIIALDGLWGYYEDQGKHPKAMALSGTPYLKLVANLRRVSLTFVDPEGAFLTGKDDLTVYLSYERNGDSSIMGTGAYNGVVIQPLTPGPFEVQVSGPDDLEACEILHFPQDVYLYRATIKLTRN